MWNNKLFSLLLFVATLTLFSAFPNNPKLYQDNSTATPTISPTSTPAQDSEEVVILKAQLVLQRKVTSEKL